MYKIQSWDAPERLKHMIPPRLQRPLTPGRTRASKQLYATWHLNQLEQPVAARAANHVLRSFPYALVDEWNSLPPDLFAQGFTLANIDSFKTGVHRHLSGI